MDDKQTGMTVEEVLGETMQTYLTVEDALLLRNTFKDNPRLLRVLQKIFIPTIQDPEMPPESLGEDFWMAGMDWVNMQAVEAKGVMAGRQEALRFLMGGLIRLKTIANVKEADIQQTRKKNSTK